MAGSSGKKRLTRAAQVYAVQLMAQHHSYMDIVRMVNEKFNLSINSRQVLRLNPRYNRVNASLQEMFYKTEKKYLEQTAEDFPISKLSYRLGEYQRLYAEAKLLEETNAQMQILERVMKEMMAANSAHRIEVSGINGTPIKIQHEVRGMSDEQIRVELARLTDQANRIIDITPESTPEE